VRHGAGEEHERPGLSAVGLLTDVEGDDTVEEVVVSSSLRWTWSGGSTPGEPSSSISPICGSEALRANWAVNQDIGCPSPAAR
jgi:hypothetical protein